MFDKPEQLEILHRFYAENDNYKVAPGHGDPDTVMVFFSSKGVFNENDFSDFEEKILKNDRYEWENLAKAPEIDRAAGSCIFVRDIRMEDYLNGISGTDCTVEKVAERLRQLTAGKKRRVFCGSSMGGFAAALLGTMLQVEAIFAFSGVADLNTFNRFLSDGGTSEKDRPITSVCCRSRIRLPMPMRSGVCFRHTPAGCTGSSPTGLPTTSANMSWSRISRRSAPFPSTVGSTVPRY